MMNLTDPGYHLKLIEMCDCYLETDYAARIEEMAAAPGDDLDEDAMKYLALAILYTVTEKAEKLSFKNKQGAITVKIKAGDEKILLKEPSGEIFKRISDILRAILHLEEDKGEMPLSLGLKNIKLDVGVKMERNEGKEKISLQMPAL